jgi:hypothetical protein
MISIPLDSSEIKLTLVYHQMKFETSFTNFFHCFPFLLVGVSFSKQPFLEFSNLPEDISESDIEVLASYLRAGEVESSAESVLSLRKISSALGSRRIVEAIDGIPRNKYPELYAPILVERIRKGEVLRAGELEENLKEMVERKTIKSLLFEDIFSIMQQLSPTFSIFDRLSIISEAFSGYGAQAFLLFALVGDSEFDQMKNIDENWKEIEHCRSILSGTECPPLKFYSSIISSL